MDRGFTIIETLLFVSVSGLIMMMVLAGFSSSLEANRRIDTNRSFEAAIEAEYTSVRSGTVVREIGSDGKVASCSSNPTSSYPGASNDCILIGKLLKIRQGTNSQISSYNVVANINPTDPCTHSGARAIIECHQARVLDISKPAGVIAPEWAAQVSGIDFQSKTGGADRSYSASQLAYIAILRDPSSELVYVVPLNLETLVTGAQPLNYGNDTAMANYTNAKGQICLKHDGLLLPKSYLRFNGGEGVGSIDVSPEPLFAGSTSC